MSAIVFVVVGIVLVATGVYFFYIGTDQYEPPLFSEEQCRSEAFRLCTQCQINGKLDDCTVYDNEIFETCAAQGYIIYQEKGSLIDYSNEIDCSEYVDSSEQN